MNSKRFLKIKVDSLKRCGVVRMLVKRKLKKRHLQHHVVFQRNKKVFQTHVFAVEKKQKNLCIGQKLIKKVKLYEAVYHRFIQLFYVRSEEHTSELQSRFDLVCRLLLEKKNIKRCT